MLFVLIAAFGPTGQTGAAGAGDAAQSHPWGAWSLVPPLLAIGLAILTHRVITALLVAVLAGALILHRRDPLAALVATGEDFLWTSLTDGSNLRVFAFTLLMAAMVGVMHRAGGMHGLVERVSPWARNRRRGQLAGWFLGLLIFFDDYANTLLLGHTMRPITDRLKVSREKLAYIVDSTAAPVAGLALVSTWVAIEIQYINQGFEELQIGGADQLGFAVFVETIVYRYYPLLALAFVGIVAWLGRDFGPMLTAERRSGGDGEQNDPGVDHPDVEANPALEPDPPPHYWDVAVIPVLVVVGAVLLLIVVTGRQKALREAAGRHVSPSLWDYIVKGESYVALVYAALAGLLVAVVLGMVRGRLSGPQCRRAAAAGAQMVVPALAILWLASAVRSVTGKDALETGNYMAHLMGNVSVTWLPTLVFLTSAVVAFATGTSWGTMGILMPLVIKVTYNLLAADGPPPGPHDPIMLGCVGGVLAGSIFGDHCSPISDTTVLSSLASHCHHIAHVRTQMPYALLVAGVAVVCGTIPAGIGINGWTSTACLLAGAVVLVVILRVLGKPVAEPTNGP